jgi:hypothetical protein
VSEDVAAALERLSTQVSDLQTQVRDLDRHTALPAPPANEVVPPGAHAWLGALETPVRRRPQLPRVLLEALFLGAAAAAAAIADLDAVAIVGVMVGAWILVALIEWAASRADREQPVPVYSAPLETRAADPAWFAPPVEHTLLDGSTGDPVTAITRLPPLVAEGALASTSADDDHSATMDGEHRSPHAPSGDPEATVEQRPAV